MLEGWARRSGSARRRCAPSQPRPTPSSPRQRRRRGACRRWSRRRRGRSTGRRCPRSAASSHRAISPGRSRSGPSLPWPPPPRPCFHSTPRTTSARPWQQRERRVVMQAHGHSVRACMQRLRLCARQREHAEGEEAAHSSPRGAAHVRQAMQPGVALRQALFFRAGRHANTAVWCARKFWLLRG